jgi:hypothetical protein
MAWKQLHKCQKTETYSDSEQLDPNQQQEGERLRRQQFLQEQQIRQGGKSTPSVGDRNPAPDIRASRAFSAPGQYPPNQFAAYAIVAFQALATDANEMARYKSICKGFLAAIPAAASLRKAGIPFSEQMVTIWPLVSAPLAATLNATSASNNSNCQQVVASTNLLVAHDAIHKASKLSRNISFNGRGPYLIAWAPATSFGKSDAAVLVLDLSNVTTNDGAVAVFQEWSDKIEQNPNLWKGGWNLNSLRITLRLWADRWGKDVLAILSPAAK